MSTTGDDNEQYSGGSEDMKSHTNECTSCEQKNVVNVTEGIDDKNILDNISACAACGKEGNSDDMNNCNKCKEVKYCNATCKKKHRKKHKKACERRVAEIYDEKLFKEVEPKECPICMLPLPDASLTTTLSCCGKRICSGCLYAMHMSEGKDLCPFCRTPYATSDGEEETKRTKSLMDKGNGEGYLLLASYYDRGRRGLQQDLQKANELLLKAGELGCEEAYYNLGNHYDNGRGVERDKKKAQHYWELSAMGGDREARYNLGLIEGKADNFHRAMKHFMLAARAGHEKSLKNVEIGFIEGFVTIDDCVNTALAYTKFHEEIKSDERDIVAEAARDREARLLGR